ncbi:tRNA threonylcarbamoyladenosine biosynthesis protein [Planococcus glaciei]|uniref:Threonylcarbamoyl-AMP synthase n=1 Tax=Planococcus glaciei TaxID=459472 RepID=A0A7H8Q6N6_9BACL|nr:L-threonylcarbamoyladenylate synthase [Planococcus glaciei]ETP67743.1 tRNA threonylcarbamoyladenosine biosynthesis protein [Planococcus glaciei CHR43]KOF09508.1 tRNA threonylcarbamoyladenosine biosynthesis protein [Planococcus glaciei]QKX49624.1 threonylcarbamoyl-AMP synthase [Planococcus glaciei]
METEIILVDKNVNKEETYSQAVEILRNEGLVAFPTETVYGLGADATNPQAVEKIFEAKGRPADNPLIVHVDSKESALEWVQNVPDKALQCMDAFWPGALTLIMKSKPDAFAENVTAGLSTVGIRVPNHPVALNLLRRVKLPIAAPSANTSGKPSPTRAEHVYHDMEGIIPLILDGGATAIGIESTVLDMTCEPPVILRPGNITKEDLEQVIGTVRLSSDIQGNAPKSPGMKYMHYAPEAPVYLIENDQALVEKAIEHVQKDGKKVAVLSTVEFPLADYYFRLSAETLYDSLRKCDRTDVDLILATVSPAPKRNVAMMNRLEKAADHKWFS